MYPLSPPAVYIHEGVMTNDLYRSRAEGVVSALETPVEPVVYRDADVPDLVRNGIYDNRKPMGSLAEVRDPILLFDTFRFDGKEQERMDWTGEQLRDAGTNAGLSLVGGGAFNWACYNLKDDPSRNDKVCRPCWRIHMQQGCVHRCHYCGLGGLLVSMVNIEEYCVQLGRLMVRHPWQYTYLLDDDADPPCLEPELGCLGPLIEYFGTLENRYVIIHTKTWNTEWMRYLQHNGNTIIVWSISGDSQSRALEAKTGTTQERIEAARIAEEAGYQIRYKFKPIIPVKTWREDASEAVRLLFEKTNPDVISLCMFMWMDVDEMKSRLGANLLDPTFLQAAEDSRDEVEDTRAKPFPHWVRAQVYSHYLAEIRKWNSEVPVSLSTENFRMWAEFTDQLGMKPTNYVCGCGPQSTPGAKLLQDHAFKVAVRNDAGLIPGVYG